ncbi:MAG: D-tyrosyl-tRNA(Tyr) deacylase [candidate division Zixibacteria bacterium RBG_19FT_COMBO_42_43]|nr:MAG: D-tyrosyl-tRNA(Tyr) deacylase [candidate division Zixibacteria bacterium RBG_19FT_COMBO_42_43]
MKVVLQRVKQSSVEVEGKIVNEIGEGMVLLVGVKTGDSEEQAKFLADKCANLRIFEDQEGKMNLSAVDVKAEILVVSQFTLYADTQKGRRPSFTGALEPREAERLYQKFVDFLKGYSLTVKAGVFGAKMLVKIFNSGPVTLILEN